MQHFCKKDVYKLSSFHLPQETLKTFTFTSTYIDRRTNKNLICSGVLTVSGIPTKIHDCIGETGVE